VAPPVCHSTTRAHVRTRCRCRCRVGSPLESSSSLFLRQKQTLARIGAESTARTTAPGKERKGEGAQWPVRAAERGPRGRDLLAACLDRSIRSQPSPSSVPFTNGVEKGVVKAGGRAVPNPLRSVGRIRGRIASSTNLSSTSVTNAPHSPSFRVCVRLFTCYSASRVAASPCSIFRRANP
jgi:hypothetical protein